MIVLDSDVLIEILDKKSRSGDEALRRIVESGEKIATTAINMHEVLYGLQKYGKPVKELLLLPTLNYTKEDAILASDVELDAERTGKAVSRTDAMIAAVTINNGAKIYTFNQKHFRDLEKMGLVQFK